jgi:hypothetical protein
MEISRRLPAMRLLGRAAKLQLFFKIQGILICRPRIYHETILPVKYSL